MRRRIQYTRFRAFINMKRSIVILLLSFYSAVAHADLDWGGGSTQFSGESGVVLSQETGCATLISVRAGGMIDFETFVPDHPADLISPGSILSDGVSINCVIAASFEFYSGYLLNSAIPDVLIDEQELLGVNSGEDLYVVVWDVNTFQNGLPTDDSYFTVLPLYFEGDASSQQAQTSGGTFSVFSNRVNPDQFLDSAGLQLLAQYGGFNTYSNFSGWVESIHSIADGSVEAVKYEDSNGNGRSNLEEYVFDSPLTVKRVYEGGLGDAVTSASLNSNRAEIHIKLRGNDPQLAYSLDVSDDLKVWRTVVVEYVDQQWICTDQSIEITESIYEGLGVWGLGLLIDSTNHSAFFKFNGIIN